MNKRHHRYGPSMLDNLSNCIRFKYIPFKDDDAASEGTLLHEAYETESLIGLDDEQTIMDIVLLCQSVDGGKQAQEVPFGVDVDRKSVV